MKGSAYCDSHISIGTKINRVGLFHRFKDFLFDRRASYDGEGKMKEFKQKGFRESWFWR